MIKEARYVHNGAIEWQILNTTCYSWFIMSCMIIFINKASIWSSNNSCNTVNVDEDIYILKPCGEYESQDRGTSVSYLPCSASCEPSSFNLRLWAPQSSSRTSRRFLVTCSQSTSSSRFGPLSSAFSVSVTKCCTIDFETLSPAFLFQPNEAILSWKGREGYYLRDFKDPIQLNINQKMQMNYNVVKHRLGLMQSNRLEESKNQLYVNFTISNRACLTRYKTIDSSCFPSHKHSYLNIQ